MDCSVSFKDVEVSIEGVAVKIGEFSASVSNYSIPEGLQLLKEIPGILKDLKTVVEEDQQKKEPVEPIKPIQFTSDMGDYVKDIDTDGDLHLQSIKPQDTYASKDTITVPNIVVKP